MRSTDNRLLHLLDLLDRVQNAPTIPIMEQSMHSFTKALLQNSGGGVSRGGGNRNSLDSTAANTEHYSSETSARSASVFTARSASASEEEVVTLFLKGHETMLQDLESHGAVSLLVRTMIQCIQNEQDIRNDIISSTMNNDGWENSPRFNPHSPFYNFNEHQLLSQNKYPYCRISPQFFNSACIALVHFAFQSRHRSKKIVEYGGFDVVVDMMRMYRSVDYVQIIGMAALMVLGQASSSFVTRTSHSYRYRAIFTPTSMEETILEQVVLAMECHPNKSKLYNVACSGLSTLWGCNYCARPVKAQRDQQHSRVHYQSGSATLLFGDDGRPTYVDTIYRCRSSCGGQHQFPSRTKYYERALVAIGYGCILHLSEDVMSLSVGENLLFNLMGRSAAERMIMYLEQKTSSLYGSFGGTAAAA